MSKPFNETRVVRIIEYYAKGFSLRESAKYFGISLQGVHQVLQRHAPHLIRRPFAGMKMDPAERLASCRRP